MTTLIIEPGLSSRTFSDFRPGRDCHATLVEFLGTSLDLCKPFLARKVPVFRRNTVPEGFHELYSFLGWKIARGM